MLGCTVERRSDVAGNAGYRGLSPSSSATILPISVSIVRGAYLRFTYDNTNTRPLLPPQALPYSQPRQFNRMTDINLDLLIPIALCVVPEIRKRWVENPRAYAVKIGHVIPFLLTCGKDAVERRPLRDVGLHELDIGL